MRRQREEHLKSIRWKRIRKDTDRTNIGSAIWIKPPPGLTSALGKLLVEWRLLNLTTAEQMLDQVTNMESVAAAEPLDIGGHHRVKAALGEPSADHIKLEGINVECRNRATFRYQVVGLLALVSIVSRKSDSQTKMRWHCLSDVG